LAISALTKGSISLDATWDGSPAPAAIRCWTVGSASARQAQAGHPRHGAPAGGIYARVFAPVRVNETLTLLFDEDPLGVYFKDPNGHVLELMS
jgi:hypothetical protein